MNVYNVTAKRWDHGWELHVDGEGVTQCRTLDGAERAVRDYVSLLHDTAEDDARVVVVPEIQGLMPIIARLRELQAEAVAVNRHAENVRLEVIEEMRAEGYSLADVAGAVGVSKGRVSQLLGR